MSPDSLAAFSKSPDLIPTPSQPQLLSPPCSGIQNECFTPLKSACLLDFVLQQELPFLPATNSQIPLQTQCSHHLFQEAHQECKRPGSPSFSSCFTQGLGDKGIDDSHTGACELDAQCPVTVLWLPQRHAHIRVTSHLA